MLENKIIKAINELECCNDESDPFKRKVKFRLINVFFRYFNLDVGRVLGDNVKYVPDLNSQEDIDVEIKLLASQILLIPLLCERCPLREYYPPPKCWRILLESIKSDSDDGE